ncbi:MAG: hypothetical protein IKJ34_05925 [Mailhella sp.]|nr:hypothetical protein [Mailhella sp.]
MMKRLAVSLSCLLFLSGCSWMSFDVPFFGDAPETVQKEERTEQPRRASASVSPEARKYLEEARKYWTGSGECVDPETAAGLLDKAIEADPLDPAPYLLRSRALSDLGYLNDAFSDATKAIRLSPTAEAYATRGLICLKQHQPRGAQRDFEYAEKLDPKEPLLYVYRSAAAFLEDRKNDACDDLERACELGLCLPWEKAQQNKVCR